MKKRTYPRTAVVAISLGSCYADALAICALIGHPVPGVITLVLVVVAIVLTRIACG